MNQKVFTNIILVVIIFIFVGVIGYFVFVKKSEQTVKQPVVIPTPIQAKVSTSSPIVKDEIASWQIYQNSDFEFELKHPNSIQVFQSGKYKTSFGEQTIISIDNADVFGIFVNRGISLSQGLEAERNIFGENIVSENKINFASSSAIELKTNVPGGFSKIILIEHPYQPTVVLTIAIAESFFDEELISQILSTFKFIE